MRNESAFFIQVTKIVKPFRTGTPNDFPRLAESISASGRAQDCAACLMASN
jgi:hypothetical protein